MAQGIVAGGSKGGEHLFRKEILFMRNVRTKLIGNTILAIVVGGVPVLTGCDKTKDEKDVTVTHPDGSTETEKSKTVEKPNGAIETKSEKSTSSPSTP